MSEKNAAILGWLGRTQGRRFRRLLLVVASLSLCAMLGFAVQPVHALPKDDGGETPNNCEPGTQVYGRLTIEGVHLDQKVVRTRPVQISAGLFKLIELRSNCSAAYHALPAGEFAWQLVAKPQGSTAVLGTTNTLSATLTPDLVGNYTVRFIGCPGGCTVFGPTVQQAFDQVLEAVNTLALPPATMPVVPAQRAPHPARFRMPMRSASMAAVSSTRSG